MSRDTLTGCLERRLEPEEIHQPIVDRCCICKEEMLIALFCFFRMEVNNWQKLMP